MCGKFFSTNRTLSVTFVLMISLVILITGCAPKNVSPPPYIPPEYYGCTEVQALDLVNAYYSHYFDRSFAEAEFNGKYIILKNIELNERQIDMLVQDDYTWVDMIQCFVVNMEYCSKLSIGDHVDIVGINTGAAPQGAEGLIFVNCYIIPVDSLNLPLNDDGPIDIPSY